MLVVKAAPAKQAPVMLLALTTPLMLGAKEGKPKPSLAGRVATGLLFSALPATPEAVGTKMMGWSMTIAVAVASLAKVVVTVSTGADCVSDGTSVALTIGVPVAVRVAVAVAVIVSVG